MSLFLSLFVAEAAQAQNMGRNLPFYLRIYPDLWYNSVDGLRVGVDLRKGQAGDLDNKQYLLDFGFWLATRFPQHPVSYYLHFTEPIGPWSSFNAAASVGVVSEYRTGFMQEGLIFQKRWQPGFAEDNYEKLHIRFAGEKLYTREYELFPELWNDGWTYLADVRFTIRRETGSTLLLLNIGSMVSTPNGTYTSGASGRATIGFSQKWALGSGFHWSYRLFGGFSIKYTPPQYRFFSSLASPREWKTNPFVRSRGTVPPVWMKEGWVEFAGGPGLRGYVYQDIQSLKSGRPDLMRDVISINTEISYPNPVSSLLSKHSFLNSLITFRSYLFGDAGERLPLKGKWVLRQVGGPLYTGVTRRIRADAGPGVALSLTFPDNEGRTRTITFRYDVPLWLSAPLPGHPELSYRNILGLNVIIPL